MVYPQEGWWHMPVFLPPSVPRQFPGERTPQQKHSAGKDREQLGSKGLGAGLEVLKGIKGDQEKETREKERGDSSS